MRIKLTTTIKDKNPEYSCEAGEEFDAVLIHHRSSTVEFETQSGKLFRAFHYEYEVLDTEEE